jgi:hypothetical protein
MRTGIISHSTPVRTPRGPGKLDASLNTGRGKKAVVPKRTNASQASRSIQRRNAPNIFLRQALPCQGTR